MEKTFDPKRIEAQWYPRWEEAGYFAPHGTGPAYCIMIPPPNVTGTLHMGHAFQDTLMDLLIRYHRMRGDKTLWQPGTDHAGIATQMVVERQLNQAGQTRHELGRAGFLEKVWEWRSNSGGQITQQLRRMGASLDWSRERFTMDDGLSEAVKEVFVRLYDEGLIYRGKRLVNWDPVLQTAVSDLEVESEDEPGHLWHLRYPLREGPGHLVVATTRPETLLGDTAVAVHPEDARYAHLIGKTVILPLVEREIPIIADDYVDPEFGSGCVKITPAHDFNDYQMGQRHDLPLINVLTPWASINEAAPAAYQGLDRYAARKAMLTDLETAGLIESTEAHTLKIPRGDRSRAVLEPFLTDQWFVKVDPLAREAIRVVEEGHIRFVPENWSKTYFEWMHRIEDWCISRQLWWGHRIPAWYDTEGRVYVGRDEAEVRARHGLDPNKRLDQDPDVLDTWFSSALWPFSTLGWPEETPELNTFYPTSVLVTGFDIIFFWVARMIMMGVKFRADVPFHEVYVHGLVRDQDGNKMSKSKGNVLDPLDLIDGIDLDSLVAKRTQGLMQPQLAPTIEKQTRKYFPDGIPAYGTDALRLTFASLATQGRDIRFDLNRIEGYRNFCNKLWNAARFVFMNTEGQDTGLDPDAPIELGVAERWIVSRLQQVEAEAEQHITAYRFDRLSQALYELTWDEYCDWYVELAKTRLNDPATSGAEGRGTRRTLVRVLEALLRLWHPIMPFITEELWQKAAPLAGRTGETIMLQAYPQADANRIDEAAIAEMEWVKSFIMGVRRIRSEMNIAPSQGVPVQLANGAEADAVYLQRHRAAIASLARIDAFTWLNEDDPRPEAATALVGSLKILIPLAGLIDKEAELARLSKEMDKLRKDEHKIAGKLDNPDFVAKAPADVVDKERQRLDALRYSLNELESQYQLIQRI
jgi:valyl-tRNA synthetase